MKKPWTVYDCSHGETVVAYEASIGLRKRVTWLVAEVLLVPIASRLDGLTE
jgi:hypothetical protein